MVVWWEHRARAKIDQRHRQPIAYSRRKCRGLVVCKLVQSEVEDKSKTDIGIDNGARTECVVVLGVEVE